MTSQSVPIKFYACTWSDAQAQIRLQYQCDWWVYGWSAVDSYWLYGNQHWAEIPPPDFSPLARGYLDAVLERINAATAEAQNACEISHFAATPAQPGGLQLAVSSRVLDGRGRAVLSSTVSPPQLGSTGDPSIGDGSTGDGLIGNGSLGNGSLGNRSLPSGAQARTAQLSIGFSAANVVPPPSPCPAVPLELFSEPVDFGFSIHGPSPTNMRWEWRDQQHYAAGAYFDLYGRTMLFEGAGGGAQVWLGNLHLIIERVADLWVEFERRPIPEALASRVDLNQRINHQVSVGAGYYGVAAVLEVLHLESGRYYATSVHGQGLPAGYMPASSPWPAAWDAMSMDSSGVISHGGVDLSFSMLSVDPAASGLPKTGTFRMRYILLARSYRTQERYVSSSAAGLSGDTRMSWKPIHLSVNPAVISYTVGATQGEIAPLEFTFAKSPVLYQDIEFDAIFDFKYLTTFRFVIKVRNTLDFAVGVIVQAFGWQAWVRLEAGQTRFLAGGVSVSGMANWHAYPLHPHSPIYGWGGNWGSTHIFMQGGRCSVAFYLFLTAPDQPETLPPNLPEKRAGQRFSGDVSGWDPGLAPEWSEIKRYSSDAQYDHDYAITQHILSANSINQIYRSITQPDHQGLINPATYFATGYGTSLFESSSPWHKRPWPGYSGWQGVLVPIMCSGEELVWNGSTNVWVPVDAAAINLSRPMMQQIAAMLDVTEYVVMDGDDLRWFVPVAYNPPTNPESFANVLWIDRFYTRSGTFIGDAAMRNAFQTVINNNPLAWPNFRFLSVHPLVRFGSFLDNGGFEVGDYLLGPDGDMVEVSSLDDLNTVSTRFLYHIQPAFQ